MLINNAMVRVLADNKQAVPRREGENIERSRPVRVGETVNANVISSDGRDTLTVKSGDGKVLTLRLEGMAAEFKPGDAISFKISDQQGEEFNAKLIKAPGLDSKQLEKSISDFLKIIDEKQTPLNKSIVSRMLDFGVPADRESFKMLQNDIRFMQRIADILGSNPNLAEHVDVNSDPANVVVKLIDALKNSNQAINATPFNSQALNSLSNSGGISAFIDILSQFGAGGGEKMPIGSLGSIEARTAIEMRLMQIMNVGIEGTVEAAVFKNIKLDPNLAIPSSQALFDDMPGGGKDDTLESSLKNMDSNRLVAEKYLELISNQSLDKSIFLKKLNLTGSFFNMNFLDKLVYGKDSLVNQLQLLVNHLSENADSIDLDMRRNIINILKSDISDVNKNLKSLSEMENVLTARIGLSDNTDVNSKLLGDIRGLRESYEFIKSMADNLAFVQVPIRNEDGDSQLEIAYRKRKEKEDDGFRIFVSLDTKNIGTVQSIIELNGRNLKIDFNVDDSLKPVFTAGFDDLRHVLEMFLDDGYDKGSVEIGFFKRKQEMTAVDLFKSKIEKQSGFELQI